MQHNANERKRKAGGQIVSMVLSKFPYRGGFISDPQELQIRAAITPKLPLKLQAIEQAKIAIKEAKEEAIRKLKIYEEERFRRGEMASRGHAWNKDPLDQSEEEEWRNPEEMAPVEKEQQWDILRSIPEHIYMTKRLRYDCMGQPLGRINLVKVETDWDH